MNWGKMILGNDLNSKGIIFKTVRIDGI